jgi:hypothetical protein
VDAGAGAATASPSGVVRAIGSEDSGTVPATGVGWSGAGSGSSEKTTRAGARRAASRSACMEASAA